MFRLLSKQIHIFSIPTYIIVLLLCISTFNVLNFTIVNTISSSIGFVGIALGYFIFRGIGLTEDQHSPLFLYTLLVVCFYFGSLNIDLAVTLLCSHLITFLLLSQNEQLRKSSYLLVGCIIGFMFLVMPESWPLVGFALIQLFAASENIGNDISKIIYALALVFASYLGIQYLSGGSEIFAKLVPYISNQLIKSPSVLFFLAPVALFVLYSIVDNFLNNSKKSPKTKSRYNMILIAMISQLLIVIFYMGKEYEYLLLLALPCSIVISRGLKYIKSRYWQEGIFWLLVLSLVSFKIAYYLY